MYTIHESNCTVKAKKATIHSSAYRSYQALGTTNVI